MQIRHASIAMAAQHTAIEKHEQRQTLTVWRRSPTPPGNAEPVAVSANTPTSPCVQGDGKPASMQRLESNLLKLLVERLSGRPIRLFSLEALTEARRYAESTPQETAAGGAGANRDADSGWGMIYDYRESHYQGEFTEFAATGIVKTTDGQQIEIAITLRMSHEYLTQAGLSVRAGEALKDPLVINFDGTAAELTQSDFTFDLDADGREEQIAFVGANSGFLALDRNEDGSINDGRELFGPTSGDGYAELARYDSDGNGWIDEADPIFRQLRIWSRDSVGEMRLEGLDQRNIGAIYLGQIATPFMLKDADNQLLGAVRATGLYLQENGMAGTIQQLDLVV
jgi:hypothetical protein